MPTDDALNRRKFLLASGAVGLTSTSGCLGVLDGGEDIELATPAIGAPVDSGAPKVLVYEDYGCPHCKTFEEKIFPQLLRDYIEPQQITYEHHDFPVPVTQMSLPTASAARSVQHRSGVRQFWEFKQRVFANQDQLGWDLIGNIANDLGLDGSAIVEDARNNRFRGVVEGDREQGREKGVTGTPGVIVDGSLVEDYGDYSNLQQKIEDAL